MGLSDSGPSAGAGPGGGAAESASSSSPPRRSRVPSAPPSPQQAAPLHHLGLAPSAPTPIYALKQLRLAMTCSTVMGSRSCPAARDRRSSHQVGVRGTEVLPHSPAHLWAWQLMTSSGANSWVPSGPSSRESSCRGFPQLAVYLRRASAPFLFKESWVQDWNFLLPFLSWTRPSLSSSPEPCSAAWLQCPPTRRSRPSQRRS